MGIESLLLGYVLLGVAGLLLVFGAMQAWLKFRDWANGLVDQRDQSKAQLHQSEEELRDLDAKLQRAEQEREELKRENEELIAELKSQPEALPPTLEEWLHTTPLTTVPNKTYRNDRIELDGFFYEHCIFEDCTFTFRGTKPFRISADSTIKGVVNIDTPGPQLQALVGFMKQLGALVSHTQFYDVADGKEIPYVASKAPDAQEDRASDEELKQRSLRLSEALFRFADERDEGDPQGNLEAALSSGERVWEASQAKNKYDSETKARYNERYKPSVRALLSALDECCEDFRPTTP